MTHQFDIKKFNGLIRGFFELKQKTDPYYYKEWRTNGTLARECAKILDGIRQQLDFLIAAERLLERIKYSVKCCKGASWYPRVPWIGILCEGEKPMNGVYPVIAFQSKEWYVGCVESAAKQQEDFAERYNLKHRTEENLTFLRAVGLDKFKHIALMPSIFNADREVTKEDLCKALSSAIHIYREFRNSTECIDHCMKREERGWVTTVKVRNLYDWINVVTQLQKNRDDKWIFRGQGNSEWKLESSLGREADLDKSETGQGCGSHMELRRAERNATQEFSREVSRDVQYRGLKGVDLLSLMQHYGSKTRLLDFSFSPLAALYFASESTADSIAVWAIRLNSFTNDDISVELKIDNDTRIANEMLDAPAEDAERGILLVRPNISNARISAQNGMFLMARNLGVSFELNLQAMLRGDSPEEMNLEDLPAQSKRPSVVKFVISDEVRNEVDTFLEAMQITPRMIFPDLKGLAESVTRKIVEKNEK